MDVPDRQRPPPRRSHEDSVHASSSSLPRRASARSDYPMPHDAPRGSPKLSGLIRSFPTSTGLPAHCIRPPPPWTIGRKGLIATTIRGRWGTTQQPRNMCNCPNKCDPLPEKMGNGLPSCLPACDARTMSTASPTSAGPSHATSVEDGDGDRPSFIHPTFPRYDCACRFALDVAFLFAGVDLITRLSAV